MKLKCRGCSVTIRLRDGGAKPGALVRVTCPRCGQRARTVVPGHAATDDVMAKLRDLIETVESITERPA